MPPAAEFYDPHRPPSQQQSHALSPSPSSTPPLLLQPHSFVSSGGASEAASAVPGIAMMGGAFGYDELAAAADGFSESNLLGQGGFGQVYKGTVRGQEVAIKKLRSGSGQGEREFQAEVEIISRVHHKNLVSLVGYCIYGEQRLLVYEYVPNKTLEFHLHGKYLLPDDVPLLRVMLGLAWADTSGWFLQVAAGRRWTGRGGGRSRSARPRASRICTRTVSSTLCFL